MKGHAPHHGAVGTVRPVAAHDVDDAYDELLGRWPRPVEAVDVDTSLGRTRVHAAGPPGAPPVLLVPGGGTCAPVWAAVAAGLAGDHRVLAVDVPGDAGRSAAPAAPVRHREQVADWLQEVLDGVGVGRAVVVGHSYGAWLALVHAIHHPERVGRLVLLDPTDCFVPLAPAYLARAAPLLMAPSPRRRRAFLRWETAGRGLDESAERLWAGQGRPTVLLRPRRPAALDLQGLGVRVDLLVAEHSRAHDPARLARRARALLPDARIATLEGVSHHQIPTERPERLVAHLRDALSQGR